jgi:hypothetical protein
MAYSENQQGDFIMSEEIKYVTKKEKELKEGKSYKLSIQSIAAFMMALQVCLSQERDMVELLRDMNFELDSNGELTVLNPPVVKVVGENKEEE